MKTIIHTPCPELEESTQFYSKLGFTKVWEDTSVIVSDGLTDIEINPDRFARAGVKLYDSNWENRLNKLKALTEVTKLENGYLLSDGNGVWIYLIEGESPLSQKGEDKTGILGNFAGISIETTDMVRSLTLWEVLGFEPSGTADQSWVSCTAQDGMVVSIMKPLSCPHLFYNPSLTYFNGGKNLEVIQKVRMAGIPITEEITHFNDEGIVDNIIIRDPGGYGFFIYND